VSAECWWDDADRGQPKYVLQSSVVQLTATVVSNF
jgi:hypothetical protein